MTSPHRKSFLFLQGPHGPFFDRLGRMLRFAGCATWRVGFNKGDEVFWRDKESYLSFRDEPGCWKDYLSSLFDEKSITDIVLYGDTRPIHAQAVELARSRGIRIHIFEEGYLRPYWVCYERDGSNGYSKLMDMSVPDMQAALEGHDQLLHEAPASWGDMKHHIFYGMLYHFQVLARNQGYKHFKPHRALSVRQEFGLYLRRLMLMPAAAIKRISRTRTVMRGGFPYHLVLLQLEHDASFQTHSPFSSITEFLDVVLRGFAQGAPAHHHLVLKAHPLEDGRAPIRHEIKRLSRELNIENRVHFLRGGKLAALMNTARSAVTVNSTAGQQALWRGIPLIIFGSAVYDKPEFVSTQSLSDFFVNPTRPDPKAYRAYRQYLLETSQIPGGFYSAKGRQQLLRQVVDMMLNRDDPYDALAAGTATPRQSLEVIHSVKG
ncbi:MAG: capsular biosynthesis protein [Litoreibacter sp.]